MDLLRQAAQQALEALEYENYFHTRRKESPYGITTNAIKALRAALAQPERKPLTDDEIELAYREIWRNLSDGFSHTSAEWIEAGIRYAEKVHGIE